MQITNIPFDITDWSAIERTEHKGESGMAYSMNHKAMLASFCSLKSAHISVDVQSQSLIYRGANMVPRSYRVSTARNGLGCLQGSG
jgi:hypothetical protein